VPPRRNRFSLEIASYCEREMSTDLERHTNEDGAYPKAGGHTLRFVKYVELKSLFSQALFQQNLRSSCSLGEIASTPSRCPSASGPGVKALVAASSSGPRSTPRSAPSRPDSSSNSGNSNTLDAGPRCGAAKPWLRAYYFRLRSAGKRGDDRYDATMHKLLAAVYSVAKTCRPFVIIQPASSPVVAIQHGVARSAWPA
jgi:hypothetical protein